MKSQYVNARPSEIQNLGSEVLGAARHRNDTYDNPEHEAIERKKKSDQKEAKLQVESLKKLTIEFMPDDISLVGEYLGIYETRLFQIQNMLRFETDILTYEDIKALKHDLLLFNCPKCNTTKAFKPLQSIETQPTIQRKVG